MSPATHRPTFVASFFAALGGGLCLFALYASSWYSYLLFHTLVEFFTILIAFLIFALVWNTRRMLDNQYLLFLGLSFLFSGALVLTHTLAYQGMEVFPGYDADLSTRMWVAFRYVFSLSFLLAPFFINRKVTAGPVLAAYGAVTAVLVGAIFWGAFPSCYRVGAGMTPFKIFSEYAVSLILMAALGLLIRKREAFDRRIFILLSGSVAASVFSALSYTQYVAVVGAASMAGHVFELIANYLIYQAVVVAGLVEPTSLLFRNLKQAEAALRKANEELEARVQERTEALTKALDTLQGEIRDRIGHERELRRVYEMLSNTLESISEGFFTLDHGWRFTYLNSRAERFFKRSAALLLNANIWETSPEPVDAAFEAHCRRAMEEKTPVVFEAVVPSTGAWVEVKAYPSPDGLTVYMNDISERKEAERRDSFINALLKQFIKKINRNEYLDAAVELIRDWSGCTSVGVRVLDRTGNIPYASCLGFSPEFLESENQLSIHRDQCACTRIIAGTPEPQDLPAMTRAGSFYTNNSKQFVESLTGEQQTRFRGVCVKSGFTSIAVVPVRHGEDVVGAIHLADEREGMVPLKSVEFIEQLAFIVGEAIQRFGIEEERVRLASAVESSADAVVITDPFTGVIQYANRAFEQITGYAREETLGRTLHFLESGKQDDEYYQGLREALAKDGVWSGRLMNKRKDGSLYFEECTVSPVRNLGGAIINYVYLKRDVTEKLRLESIAESINTMNNIGFVFSGVRHEIGNPVNTVNMILGILRSKLDTLPTDAVREYLGRMAEQVGRVEYILRSLKSFNLYETQQPHHFQAAFFFENFLPLIRDDLEKKGITIKMKSGPAALWLYADPRALQQALLNVLTNAADALSGRTDPTIAMSVQSSGGMIVIRIEDNGCGIPEDKLQSIFIPFFTTKPQGTGLGLVIVKKMLANMNGTIEIESRQNAGTMVNIALPEGRDEKKRP